MLVIVVGSGIIGLLTALACLDRGVEVCIVEQANIPNPQASSMDQHRINRILHPADFASTRRAQLAFSAWLMLEARLGRPISTHNGCLTILPSDQAECSVILLQELGVAHSRFDTSALLLHYPQLRFSPDAVGILEHDTGTLLASQVLHALVDAVSSHPLVRLQPNSKIVAIEPDKCVVELSSGRKLQADALLVAAGAWSRELLSPWLPHVPILWRQSLVYCLVPLPHLAAWRIAPSVPKLGTLGGGWIVPPVADTALKLSCASACRPVTSLSDRATPIGLLDMILNDMCQHVVGLDRSWVTSTCDAYYLSRSLSDDPWVVQLSRIAPSLALAACGGRAFKFAPLLALELAELLLSMST